MLRAVGDSGSGTLSWLSPLGWAQAVRASGDERWWVLALPVAAVAVLAAVAFALVSRRDHGLGLLAVVAAGYVIQAVLRIRAEEAAYRAEEVLATPVSRWRWAGGHVACAALGTALIMLAAGLGIGLVHGLRTGDLGGQLPRHLEASLAQMPAAWILGGLAFALTGLLPRLVAVAWAVFAVYFMIGQVGEAFDLPDWVLDLSPFRHAPQLPLTDLRVAPLVALIAASLVLAAGGMVGLRRRDIA